ncbi:MAG TPA: hypothetical protein VHA52_02175, partial [Candidatus Babeliaceae bacterium]|nr:hypothetical protein [Candidatus Babeliaceae bacterium]
MHILAIAILGAFVYLGFISNVSAQNSQGSPGASYNQLAQQITGGGSQALSRGKQFLTGIASSFGYCPSGYTYSFQVWNDLPTPLYAAMQTRRAVQGAQISTTIEKNSTICPFGNSSGTFFNLDLCHGTVWLDADTSGLESYSNIVGNFPKGIKGLAQIFTVSEELNKYNIYKHTIDVQKGDKNTYFYRTYLYKGKALGEFLGPNVTSGPWASSTDFDGVFYNSTDKTCTLSFEKDSKKYPVSLEPHSFNLLSSTLNTPHSIRPENAVVESEGQGCSIHSGASGKKFAFMVQDKTVDIPIAQEGLGKLYTDPKTQVATTIPATYTFEIYADQKGIFQVGLQGLSIGNFDQVGVDFQESKATIGLGKQYNYPLLYNVRDLNPLSCYFWYQSPEQYVQDIKSNNAEQALEPYTQGIFIWLSYKTKDQTILLPLSAGTVTQVELIRPQISEKQAHIYIVSLPTSDQAVVQKFMERLHSGVIAV